MAVGLDHPLVAEYLRRLDAAASGLPPGRREELLAEIRSHVADALASVGDDEASVHGVLDRVGSPQDIVGAESDDRPIRTATPPPTPARSSPWGPLEIIAVAGLTVGAVLLPLVGPLLGVVCAWASARWTRREKIVATIWTALAPVMIVLLGASLFVVRTSTEVQSDSPAVVEEVAPVPAPGEVTP